MVGKRDTKTETVDSDYFKCLKQNNISLAKALTEERLNCKQYLEERIALQKKLDASLLLNIRYQTILSKLLAESKRAVPVCTAILSNIQQILTLSSDGVNLPKLIDWETKEKPLPSSSNINSKRSASPVVNKTHAVKPMVSGHVIFRPTINLWRLADTEQTELNRNLDSPNSVDLADTTNTSNNDNVNNREPVQELHSNLYDLDITDPELLTESNNGEPLVNGRLEGLEAVPEEPFNLSEFSFREARVVINPLPSHFSSTPSKRLNISINDDPLEGPSTLLDDSGQFTSPPIYVSKPRAASTHFSLVNTKQRRVYDSDSSSDEEVKRKVQNNRNVSKRKLVIFKDKDEKSNDAPKKSQNKKVKRNNEQTTVSPLLSASISQPYVVLKRENLLRLETSHSSNDSKGSSPSPSSQIDDQNVNDRPRRNKLKGSFKEMSLRCKLRRDK